jgi:hypothetical protein
MIALKRNQDNNMMVHTGATSTQNVYFDKDYNLRDIDEKCSLKDLLRELSNPSRAKQEQTRNTQYSTNYPLGEEKNQNDVEKETKVSLYHKVLASTRYLTLCIICSLPQL